MADAEINVLGVGVHTYARSGSVVIFEGSKRHEAKNEKTHAQCNARPSEEAGEQTAQTCICVVPLGTSRVVVCAVRGMHVCE